MNNIETRILKHRIKSIVNSARHEQNTNMLRARVENEIGDALKGVNSEYRVICDETNNSPSVLNQYQLQVDVYIKPNRCAEYIQWHCRVSL